MNDAITLSGRWLCLCLLAILIALSGAVPATGGETRTFTNAEGSEIEAEFISVKGGIVTMRRVPDNKTVQVPMASLSEEDRTWIESQGKPLLGIWGGKWDDQWPVFITVAPGDEPGKYAVVYTWVESFGRPFRESEREGEQQEGGYIRARALFFKLSQTDGMLYGKFRRPRMARLVRISEGYDIDLTEIELADYGWEPGAIPAGEAYTEITGKKEGDE